MLIDHLLGVPLTVLWRDGLERGVATIDLMRAVCPVDDEQPMLDFRVLEKELDAYNKELVGRRYVIVLNKIDLIDEERLNQVERMFAQVDLNTISISAETGEGLEELKEILAELFDELRESKQ